MQKNSTNVGIVLLVALSLLTMGFTHIALGSPTSLQWVVWEMIFFFVAQAAVIVGIVKWVSHNAPSKDMKSRRKVEKVLRELDDNDLDLLRNRLIREDRSDDYSPMAELVQSGKRKNEVR